jgi:hypothetical protein
MAEEPMSGDEFDDYMDGLTIRKQNQVLGVEVIDFRGNETPPGDKFILWSRKLALRFFWLASWGWLFFTFGWVGHVLIRWIEKREAWNEGN